MGIPENVYRWNPTHPIFTDPETVPDLTSWVEGYGDNGDHVAPLAGVAAVAGFTASYSANDSGIIVRDDGRAIVNSFLVCEARGDADADGQVDAVELWTDEIEYITEGGAPPEREVLMYQDDAYGNYFAQDALDALGYNYTVFTDDFAGFETALTTGSWDLVILNDCNWTPPDTTLDAVEAYINAGGKAILVSWRMMDGHSLWTTAGLTGAVSYGAPGTNVYRWEPSHPIFTTPDVVSDFTWWNPGIAYGVWGHTFTPTAGSALAGTDPTPPGAGTGQNAIGCG